MRHIGQFLFVLSLAALGKYVAGLKGYVSPALSAWEIAALVHLVVVAFSTTDDEHLELAHPRFDAWLKRIVLGGSGVFLALKVLTVFLETDYVTKSGDSTPLVTLNDSIHWIDTLAIALTPYVIVMPLFFFLLVNLVAIAHTKRQATRLGQPHHRQVVYLKNLVLFVDLPVVVPFFVLWVYLRLDPVLDTAVYPLGMGLVGCCLLVVSNVAAGVFHEHWEQRDGSGFIKY